MTKQIVEYYDTSTMLDAIDRRLESEETRSIFVRAVGLHNKNAILPENIERAPLSKLVKELGTNTVQTALDLIVSSFRLVEIEMSDETLVLQHHSRWKRFKDLMRVPKDERCSDEMRSILKEQQEEAQFWEEKPWRR